MNEYLIFAEKKPEPKKTIEYIDIYGLHGYAKDYKINVDKKI